MSDWKHSLVDKNTPQNEGLPLPRRICVWTLVDSLDKFNLEQTPHFGELKLIPLRTHHVKVVAFGEFQLTSKVC